MNFVLLQIKLQYKMFPILLNIAIILSSNYKQRLISHACNFMLTMNENALL